MLESDGQSEKIYMPVLCPSIMDKINRNYTRKNPLTVWFFGSKPIGYQCLEYLISREEVKVNFVIARPKDYEGWWNKGKEKKIRVRDLAENNHIPVYTHNEFVKHFRNGKIEIPHLIISVEHRNRIPEDILECAEIGALNLHLAPLPTYRGCNTFSHAIINRDKEYWCTMHYMSPRFDDGEIIATGKHVKIGDKSAKELYDEVIPTAFELFKNVINKILSGDKIPKIKQEEIGKSHYYFRKELDEIKIIRANELKKMEGDNIERIARACWFPPFEPAYIELENGKKIYLCIEKDR